jgi:hypothetical protein
MTSILSFGRPEAILLRMRSSLTMKQELTYMCPFCDREVRVGMPCEGCAKKQKPAPTKAKRSWEQDKM